MRNIKKLFVGLVWLKFCERFEASCDGFGFNAKNEMIVEQRRGHSQFKSGANIFNSIVSTTAKTLCVRKYFGCFELFVLLFIAFNMNECLI